MFINVFILFFVLSSFPMKSECCPTPVETPTTTTTQSTQEQCTPPICYRNYTLEYDPEGCNCPTMVPCPDLTCSEGTHPHWNGDNCVCPECVVCPTTCPPMLVTCPMDELRTDTCGCLLCDDIMPY